MVNVQRRTPQPSIFTLVHWVFPVTYVVFFLVLSITAVVYEPGTYIVPFCIMLLGVPLYYLSRSRWGQRGHLATLNRWITIICHRLLLREHACQEAA
ncbi:uncharacterized protein LOC124263698 isoform X2 [Haliotis rubra]|uniref:uncharacterized protein LOC124263698 isoform X2 n=1 Tax=Haliotis rubra TaxID=36100 RepID=UPI001EE5B2F6|nr:uncharacterized protein LOC124263698 isoform X2 [Haliotis rubra]